MEIMVIQPLSGSQRTNAKGGNTDEFVSLLLITLHFYSTMFNQYLLIKNCYVVYCVLELFLISTQEMSF